MLRDALNPGPTNTLGIVVKLDLNWDYASARRLRRIAVDAEGARKMLLNFAGDCADQCGARRVIDKAPHLPVAGTPVAASFPYNNILFLDIITLLLDDVIAMLAMYLYSEYSPLVRVRSTAPLEVWDAFAAP